VTTFTDARYILLTTFRRNGAAVGTPVWFVEADGLLLVWSAADAGKVKRIRANGRVTVSVCTVNGRATTDPVEGTARVLPAEDGAAIQRLLNTKYGIVKRVLDLFSGIGRRIRRTPRSAAAYLEISVPADPS
jgi:PPOX class probable F420-dependent enzyme